MEMKLFREDLDKDEIVEFKKWARENYKPMDVIKGVWHPVVQDECVKMNQEAGKDITGLFDSLLSSNSVQNPDASKQLMSDVIIDSLRNKPV